MPETIAYLQLAMRRYRDAKEDHRVAKSARDYFLRKGRDEGLSLAKLAEASGLSVAQVQRICDLSKDRSG